MENNSHKAQEILQDLRSIIDEQEVTISQQHTDIENLQSKVKSLAFERDDLKQKIQKMEAVLNHTNSKKHKKKSSSSKNKSNNSLHQQTNGAAEEVMPSKLERSNSLERSGSIQRKHLEEQDASYSRTAAYELSSDIRDRQVEALRNFYGGAAKSEHAARIIQEAYRSFKLKHQFKKIKRSNTRRLTIGTIHISADKTSESMRRCKSVGYSESDENDNSFSELNEKSPEELEPSLNEQKTISSVDSVADAPETETFTEATDNQSTEESTTAGDRSSPLTVPPLNPNDVSDFSNEELVNRILQQAPITNVVRRKKRHGYETIVLPNQGSPTNSEATPAANPDSVVVRLRRPMQNHSPLSLAPSNDFEPHLKQDNSDYLRTSSRISLTSNENDAEIDSLRSSDTASIASEMSQLTLENVGFHPSHFRRSMLSVRGSIIFDSDVYRKRLYRIGLNLFNVKPAKGLKFLMDHRFVGDTAPAVASFLLNRKGLSRQMVGEYLGNTQKVFNQEVLDSVTDLMEFSNLELDEALRLFQSQIKVQGEAQKVERLVEAFSQRFCTCNPKMIESLQNPDSIFVLAFAIIMLNTDLHSPNMKHEKRMTEHDFIKNLKGVDNGDDLSEILLKNIYNRIKTNELTTMDDHMTSVLQIENSIIGKKPVLAVPHRRLVCFVRMFQVADPSKPQRHGLHQREVFLFNDMMLVMKILHKKKSGTTYTLKQSISLHGLSFLVFESTNYSHGIRLINSLDNSVLINFNAPNEIDRKKFVSDVKECICEVQQMEALRIEAELEKAQSTSPLENRSYGYLSVESKKLSTSMQNLNENKLLSVAKNGNTQRPISMYDFNPNNNNNNNNSYNNASATKTVSHARSKSPGRSSLFIPAIGNFFRSGSKRQGPISSLVSSPGLTGITYTSHTGNDF